MVRRTCAGSSKGIVFNGLLLAAHTQNCVYLGSSGIKEYSSVGTGERSAHSREQRPMMPQVRNVHTPSHGGAYKRALIFWAVVFLPIVLLFGTCAVIIG